MVTATPFAKMVPGFDFLQGLVKNAGAGLPNIGQWIAPTLDPQELAKRIEDLRTVQFWLEQNARLLGTTIQALEVQRMTLSTLQGMNLPLAELRDALKVQVPDGAPAAATAPASAASKRASPRRARASRKPAAAATTPAPLVDPMQWWGALTQQFTELAAKAVKDGAGEAARNLAQTAVQQSVDAAGATIRQAGAVPAKAARAAMGAAGAAGKAARTATRRR